MRAIASVGPPAENGTTMVMGWAGNWSAMAVPTNVSNETQAARIALRMFQNLQLRVVDRLVTIERAVDFRQRVFKACGAVEQHDPITFVDAAIGEALLVGGVGR